MVGVEDRVGEAAGVPNYRDGAIFESDELREAARLVLAGNKNDIGPGIDEVSELFVVTDFEVAIGMIIEAVFEVPEGSVDVPMWAGTKQHELAAAIEAVRDSSKNEVHAFLMVQSANEGNDGTELFAEPKPITKSVFVDVFIIDGFQGKAFGNVRVGLRIPDVVIEAIENAAELSVMNAEDALKAHAEVAVTNFGAISWRDGGDKIRIDDATFHQVDRAMTMIIGQSIVCHHVGRIQSNLSQNVFSVNALVADIVQCKANTRVTHAEVLINLVEEHRHQGSLPIMTVNDVRVLSRFEHEFERGAGEESEPLDIVMVAVKNAAIEEIVMRMGIDEETFESLHEAEINVAMNPLVMVRNRKITVGFGEAPDAIVTHAIVFRQDDLDRIAANAEFAGKTLNDIGQPADFCRRSALGCDHYDEHGGEGVT